MKDKAMLLFGTTRLLCSMLGSGGETFDIIDYFPYWTDEEKREIYHQRMIKETEDLYKQLLANSDTGGQTA